MSLNSLHAEYFYMPLCHLLVFFCFVLGGGGGGGGGGGKINFFKNFFQEHYQFVKWFGFRSGPTLCRIGKLFSLFLNQNICCGYSKEPSQ